MARLLRRPLPFFVPKKSIGIEMNRKSLLTQFLRGRFGRRSIAALAAFAAAAVLGLLAPPLAAQDDCLKIMVTDPSGAAVPAATVVIGAAEQPTDDQGAAVFCGLGAGPHSVTVTAPGLAAVEQTVTQSTGTVMIEMQIAAVTQELVVVGSRTEGRTVMESAVPVDLVTADEFMEQGDPDLPNQLRNTVPSFNVNTQPISDAGTIVRPASLRNLNPDHTLVLVNGKRRHRAAVIHWVTNGVSDGAQGPDLSVIPSIALRHAEVLRDGASAQYGSDAIAGVMNFVLKDADSGGSLQLRTGGYGAGDGHSITFAGNVGLPLGEGGFANLSIEYGKSDPTSRSVQRYDATQLIANGNTNVRSPAAQIWGNPDIDDDVKFWGNFGKFVGGSTQLYAHTNYASKRVDGGFYFRNPHTRGGVYSKDGGKTLLVGDVLDAQDGVLDGSAGCPTVRVSGGRILDPDNFAAVQSDPNCFTFHQPFAGAAGGRPGGFTPQFGGNVLDNSIVGGVRGALTSSLTWDASISLGSNKVDFFIYNTVNASLGPESPTSFKPGSYEQQDTNFNFDLTYAASDTVHVAAGAEWRNEQFTVTRGGQASYQIGPYAAQGFSGASNGFPGFSPIAEGSWDRRNVAVYGDIELGGANSRYTISGALRGERFNDFGSTINYKLAGRYELADGFALRAGHSTGFRAPTPGQQNAFNVSTIFDPVESALINQGTIPPTSRVAAFVGGEPLQPEKSRNYTAGFVAEKGPFTLSADYFRIDLRDRLWISRQYSLDPDQVDQLVSEGITSAANIGTFRFFTNDFDTSTNGVDVIGTFTPTQLGGRTTFSFLLNHTKSSVTYYNPETVTASRINLLENVLPESRWSLTARHREGKFRFLVRLSYWGDFFDREDALNYPGEYLSDLEVTYQLTERFSVSGGGQNIFNNYPEINPGAFRGVGNMYPQSTPFGFNGGYYYMRLNYSWDKAY